MAAISGTDAGDRERDSDDGRGDAARTAHGVLSRVCVDPAHGVCPRRTRALDPPKRGLWHTSASGTATTTRRNLRAPRQFEADGRRVAASRNVTSGAKRCATLVRLLRKLRPTESRRHAELLLRVCELRPHIAALYLPHATYSLDPRPSIAWLAAAALLGEVAAAASLDPAPPRAPPEAPGEAEAPRSSRRRCRRPRPAPASRRPRARPAGQAPGALLAARVLCAIRRRVARLDGRRRPPPTPARREPNLCGARAARRAAPRSPNRRPCWPRSPLTRVFRRGASRT